MTAPARPTPRRRALLVTAATAAAAAGLGVGWWRHRQADDTRTGGSLWPLRFEQPTGGELRLETLRGRPLLVNFWATWCPPCVGELPLLDRFAHAQTGWQVVGLAVDQLGAVRDFLALHPVAFPVGLAGLEGVELARRFGNTSGGLPFSLVLGADGQIADRKLGSIAAADFDRWVRSVR